MFGGIVDRADGFLARHQTAVTIVAGVWFWLGVAVAARFIDLPDLPWDLPDAVLLWSGIGANVAWWGFLRPAIERRRAARTSPEA